MRIISMETGRCLDGDGDYGLLEVPCDWDLGQFLWEYRKFSPVKLVKHVAFDGATFTDRVFLQTFMDWLKNMGAKEITFERFDAD